MDIGTRLAQIERRLDAMERQARLSHASIDNTAVTVKDGDGSLRGIIGVQPDGTTAVNIVNGPPPPAPAAPTVLSVLGGIRATWGGTFADGSVAPMDWSRVEVHASTAATWTPDSTTLRGTIETPQGGDVVIPTDVGMYVCLVTRNTSGTASAPSAIVGPKGPTPVVAQDILDGIVTASKIANGAVRLNALTPALADTASQRYVDAMGDSTAWTVLTKAAGASLTFLDNVADAPTGKTVAQATGYHVIRGTVQIPYDPDVLYRVSARVRTTTPSAAGTDVLYVGILGIAADGVTMVSTQGTNVFSRAHYAAADPATLPQASGWTTYVGYLRGRANPGVGTAAPDPRAPHPVHDLVRFVSPILYLNYGSGTTGTNSSTGTMQVDAFTIEALKTGVVDGTNLVVGSVSTAALATDSVTTAKLDALAVTTAKLDALAVTADKIATNSISTGMLQAGAVDATALKGDAITGKTITGGTITGTTITGGTITGSVIQTATSGARMVLNETGANDLRLYDSTGINTGLLASTGLLVAGTSGAVIWINPAAAYPQINFYNATRATKATVQVVEAAAGDANLESFTGRFTGSGYTDMVWRTYLARDFAAIERLRATATGTVIGARLRLEETVAALGIRNTDDATKESSLVIQTNQFAFTTSSATPFTITGSGFTASNIKSGHVTVNITALNSAATVAVTGLAIPAGITPRVAVAAITSTPHTCWAAVSAATSDGFTVYGARSSGALTAIGVDWIVYAS